MEITPIGVVLIVLGACFFLARPDLLYWCAIFFVPFSSTAVVNVGSNGSYSALQAWTFFGTLWIASQGLGALEPVNFWYRHLMRASVRKLAIFLLVALCSLIMPLWINGRLLIYFQSPTSNDAHPLFFSLQHVTQLLYLAFGVIFAVLVGLRNLHLTQFLKTLRIVLFSAIFVNLWGLLQSFCYQRGLDYPAFLLNTNKNENAMGFSSAFSDLDIPRVSSVATEPSVLAQYLIIILIFALFAVFGKQPIISKFWDRSALVLSMVVVLMTTSSTGYIGLALLIPVVLFAFLRLGKLRSSQIVMLSTIAAGISIVVYSTTSIVQNLLDTLIFSKADSYSGLERLNSVLLAAGYFVQYPILGVGWGSITSHDLIFKILADTGIAGLLAFALFLKSLGAGLWKSSSAMRMQIDASAWSYWASCMLVANVVFLLVCAISEFTYVFGPIWLLFGLSLAALGQQITRRTSSIPVLRVHA